MMNAQNLTRGTQWSLPDIRGHKVQVSPWFLGIIALFVFMGLHSIDRLPYQLMWAPVLFGSILLHELGHAAATKKCGFGTSRIVLHGFGGVAISQRQNTRPKDGMFIALAGPAVTLVLAVVFLGLLVGFQTLFGNEAPVALDVAGHFIWLMFVANVFWFVLNMLPIYPLDGGQTLMHFFRKRGDGRSKATVKTAKVSMVAIAVAALVSLVTIGGFFIIIICGFLGYMNWQILQRAQQGGVGPGGPGGGMVMKIRK